MALKWQRNYVLNVQDINGNNIEIQYPLSLEFYIKQEFTVYGGTATFRIYNLKDASRQNIRKDWTDTNFSRYILLQAGYGIPPYPVIFSGTIQFASSYRDSGSPNYITEITGLPHNFNTVNAFINTTLAPGASQGVSKDLVVSTLVNNIVNTPAVLGGGSGHTGLSIGYITKSYAGQYYPRGRVLLGNSWQLLNQETMGAAFINNGKLNILQPGEAFVGGIQTIDASTGLLSTPRMMGVQLEVEILFEPNIAPGQWVQLISTSSPEWNGQYKVYSVEHRGIISGSVNGKCTTKVLFYNSAVAGTPYVQIPNIGLPAGS